MVIISYNIINYKYIKEALISKIIYLNINLLITLKHFNKR
jgi:hypothetical protein